MNTITLWIYNRKTGYWNYVRACAADTADEWLRLFAKDEPHESFKLARTKPKGRPDAAQ